MLSITFKLVTIANFYGKHRFLLVLDGLLIFVHFVHFCFHVVPRQEHFLDVSGGLNYLVWVEVFPPEYLHRIPIQKPLLMVKRLAFLRNLLMHLLDFSEFLLAIQS